MIVFLADHDVEGQARLLFGALNAGGWLDLLPLRLVTFAEVGLAEDSPDRRVWRLCQERALLLLTANRAQEEPDSLEATLREEGSAEALPVITISTPRRLLDRAYLDVCAVRLVEIALDLDNYRGTGRIFVP